MKEYKEPYVTGDKILEYLSKESRMYITKTMTDIGLQNPHEFHRIVNELCVLGYLRRYGNSNTIIELTFSGLEVLKTGGFKVAIDKENEGIFKVSQKDIEEGELRRLNIENAKRQVKSYRLSIAAIIISILSLLYNIFIKK